VKHAVYAPALWQSRRHCDEASFVILHCKRLLSDWIDVHSCDGGFTVKTGVKTSAHAQRVGPVVMTPCGVIASEPVSPSPARLLL
jgi:hypothetical protein